jgi:pilus assembly protein CpaF
MTHEVDPSLGSRDLTVFEPAVRRHLHRYLLDDVAIISEREKDLIVEAILQESVGYGLLDPLLADTAITEIMVNGSQEVFIERSGRLELIDVRFEDDDQLLNIVRRLASDAGRRIDESSPMVDAKLPDGSRMNAVIPPVSSRPVLTIRKFSRFGIGFDDLVASRTLSPKIAIFLEKAVQGRLNILISGGTGSGKTTTMNLLGSVIPEGQRVVTLEDSLELNLGHSNVIALEARPANVEGKGEITIRQLLRNSLRMRPDRLLVGEVRGAEAVDMLQAMNTGHEGSITTLHANSAVDALSRLETMVLLGSMDLPLAAIRSQINSAIDLIVHMTRMLDGTRVVSQVAELRGFSTGQAAVVDIFRYDGTADAQGRFIATGEVPETLAKLAFQRVQCPPDLFEADPELAPGEREPEAVEDTPTTDDRAIPAPQEPDQAGSPRRGNVLSQRRASRPSA